MKTKLAIILTALLLAGCREDYQMSHHEAAPMHTTPEGFRYQIITIEGRRFIISESGSYGRMQITGPIDP